ncbi:ATP-binding protein [bacterium]|nr:ATP-binding protein [bacterium]
MEIKKESRIFGIKAFRNIGFDDQGTPTNEKLYLNYSLNKEYLGDLVILIGPNNSGKSNVLDALECFAKYNITDRDKSDNFMNDDQLKPNLSLVEFIDDKPHQS